MNRIFMESDINIVKGENKCAVLTEAGIELPNGEIINDGKLLEAARECKRLLEEGDKNAFLEYVMGTEFDNETGNAKVNDILNKKERNFLFYKIRIRGGSFYDLSFPLKIETIVEDFEDDEYESARLKEKQLSENNMLRVFLNEDVELGYGILLSLGIKQLGGEFITEGRVLKVVKECQRLLAFGNREGFYNYLLGDNRDPNRPDLIGENLKRLTPKERNLVLFGVRISAGPFEKPYTPRIYEVLDYFEKERLGEIPGENEFDDEDDK
jgi:hypothetical protein